MSEIAGPARVVDGDTLIVAGERIRLFAIDAPERDQTCSIDGRSWACGIAAWGELVQITAGKEVSVSGATPTVTAAPSRLVPLPAPTSATGS